MSDLMVFLQLGFRHITNAGAADHILFLVALAAIYRFKDWRSLLWVVSAFTVGHSITLLLAASGTFRPSPSIIEFLIPVTIVATCIENLFVREQIRSGWRGRYRPVFAGVFGLVHGAGFARYLQDLFLDDIAVPLLGFNIGIELGQIAVLAVVLSALWVADAAVERLRKGTITASLHPSTVRLRAIALSSGIMVVAIHWAYIRKPW